jgi:hypothetical protein
MVWSDSAVKLDKRASRPQNRVVLDFPIAHRKRQNADDLAHPDGTLAGAGPSSFSSVDCPQSSIASHQRYVYGL